MSPPQSPTMPRNKARCRMRSGSAQKRMGTATSRVAHFSPEVHISHPRPPTTAMRPLKSRGRRSVEKMAFQLRRLSVFQKMATIYFPPQTARPCQGARGPKKASRCSTCAYSRPKNAPKKHATTKRSVSTTMTRTRGAP